MDYKAYLVCDESGGKGYSNKPEKYPGEVGVFAGLLLSEQQMSPVSQQFNELFDEVETGAGKTHISELDVKTQEYVRREIYKMIESTELPCFWYAIHVEGFHDANERTEDLLAASREEASQNLRFKRGSPRRMKKSLHVALFNGLYSRLIAFLEERCPGNVEIEIVMDLVDGAVRKEMEYEARNLLNWEPRVSRSTAYDTEKKQVVEGKIEVAVTLPKELEIQTNVESLKIRTERKYRGLTLAADVLANSLNHTFSTRTEDQLYTPLNNERAIRNHPLFSCLNTVDDWTVDTDLSSTLFRHPKSRRRSD